MRALVALVAVLAARETAAVRPASITPEVRAAVRQMHQHLLPSEETVSEAEADAHFDEYLSSPHAYTEPIWTNHSHAERTDNLRNYYGLRSERRRLQPWARKWDPDSPQQGKDANVMAVLDRPASACEDPLATSVDQAQASCTYDCETLRNEYFPDAQQTTRCFLFDASTETWPEQGGQRDELLSMRQQRRDVYTYVEPTPNPAGDVLFSVGKGRICRNVTIVTTMFGQQEQAGETQVVCLVDGEHEYNHTVTDEHAVEVVGYAESGLRDGAGGSTRFVVGECIDLLIRVTTTSAGGGPVTWSVDDGGHNGPWTFESPGSVGVHEYPSCSFDNDFTLTRQAGSSWQGTVEVAGFIHYHNTITIPSDENWIVQGAIDPDTGLPAGLDGRLSSGSKADRSRASIVLRQVRFSGQIAPVDFDGRPALPEGGTVGGRKGGSRRELSAGRSLRRELE